MRRGGQEQARIRAGGGREAEEGGAGSRGGARLNDFESLFKQNIKNQNQRNGTGLYRQLKESQRHFSP